ncbi:TetR/AcrR family transcriptional regulator [Saccharopolyspora elongata]|uniref:TetR/AcrR family transcriptional regulator n=1 Tax=Saccharopolyspora elongata TaxID=2530387 RepID=A0A4R4YD24_9PSEU|nr:TetR/AcrR family transcriptional regulator [Saccharopolyspora elongata]TDD42426.1 TetR/AcrR family transcriptional regulator [Saccharopolyspora elongata]
MPRNRQHIPKAEREAAVVGQAVELFVTNGYRGTSITSVGRAAGIAAAAVHWYFPTKDDLFAAALSSIFETARDQVEADPAIGGDPRDELVALLAEVQPYRALHREAYERMAESESVCAAYQHVHQWMEQRLFAAIASRLPEGADIDLVADVAHVLFEGILVSTRRLDRPLGDLIDLIIDSLVAAAIAKVPR